MAIATVSENWGIGIHHAIRVYIAVMVQTGLSASAAVDGRRAGGGAGGGGVERGKEDGEESLFYSDGGGHGWGVGVLNSGCKVFIFVFFEILI